ncbi:phosphoribosylformylglycinamidine cyclo-ligase [Leptolyngbya sp. 7M]|uniref:phosphoribosylformylglycinamidine cyclo-ligase n=1 Tax=Leptolyngbya sp. 7M TaxID=2812896 RepID=UPI001B8D64B7|nr:AIR synthase-related protein [Leptolyngbya sp. 7M]QYO62841.1 hypothetical protein JVX88_22865 [Leptolyngbya sp. 7M]
MGEAGEQARTKVVEIHKSGSAVQVGDVAVGLASAGLHSNGYSLVRKIIELTGHQLMDRPNELGGRTLAEELLTPTQIYVKPVLSALRSGLEIHGMAHITGGGLPENLPRCLAADQSIRIQVDRWEIPPVFEWLASRGAVAPLEMFNTFNMGIGYVLLVPSSQVESTIQWFTAQELPAYAIGEVIAGAGELVFSGL